LHRLDARLAASSREDAALRLRLGQALEVLREKGHCFALGFSSPSAYALERCDRSARWLEGSRHLARRLEALPQVRRALARGELTWSAAELVARVARREDEASWLSIASRHTVRELHQLVRSAPREQTAEARERRQGGEQLAEADPHEGAQSATDAPCTLTITVDREDAWLFASTRTLLDHLGTHGTDAQVEAMLGEAQANLLAHLPRGTVDPDVWERVDATEQRWREQLRQ
jgi:hypothetical protein